MINYDSYIKLIDLRSRMYSPETGRFLTKDSWLGDYNRPLSLNRWNYTEANPINFVDPSGYIKEGVQAQKAELIVEKLKQYNAHIEKDWGSQLIPYGYLYYSGCEWKEGLWTVDQLSIILSSFNKIRNRLNVSEATVAKIIGGTTFRRVDKIFSLRVGNPIADSSPSGLVRLTAEAFDTEWYVLHELGHIFDFQRIEGNLKSHRFMDEFQTPCAWNDLLCSYTYNPSDKATTDYGLTSVLEDFADTFATTIFYNGVHGQLLSQKRIDIMNDLLTKAVNGN